MSFAHAERLPLTPFTSEQGLVSDAVLCATEDRDGFIWFGTYSGLSRFDGQGFRNFGQEQGLTAPAVFDLLELEGGRLLVGTNGGIFRFDPSAGGSFTRIPSEPSTLNYRVYFERDRRGRIWAGANGLYLLDPATADPVFRRVPVPAPYSVDEILDLLVDGTGDLWIAGESLYRVSPNGRWQRVLDTGRSAGPIIHSLAEDDAGSLWANVSGRLWRITHRNASGEPESEAFPLPGPPASRVQFGQLVARRGGGVWLGTTHGVQEVDPVRGVVRTIGHAEGLPTTFAFPLLEDRGGNLWASLPNCGVVRLAPGGLTTFSEADGLVQTRIGSIFRTISGDLVVVSDHVLQRFDGERFTAVIPNLPTAILHLGWGWYQFELEDREGNWWIPTDDGIVRFGRVPKLEDLVRAPPKAVYTEADGLSYHQVFRLFQDSRGDIWAGTFNPGAATATGSTLSRWERATGDFHRYGPTDGVPNTDAPTAFIELKEGDIWIGFGRGPLLRYRGGRFAPATKENGGVLGGGVTGLYSDRRARLWIGTDGGGLYRIDEPEAAEPALVRLTMQDGLSSDQVTAVTGDNPGRIYAGTPHGVDVLENDRPIRHFGTSDGLPHPHVSVLFSDPRTGVWIGTLNGLARLDSRVAFSRPQPPCVRIDGLRIAGAHRPISGLGETSILDLVLAPDERRLEVDLTSLSHEPGEPIRFQHRLHESEAWSEPRPDRTLVFPALAPGRYRLEVRGMNEAGAVSEDPAVVSFRVLAPFWRRPWFLGLVALVLGGLAAAAYRARVGHLLALERQRTRIAMDLHDELGSGLGSIGLLADLVSEGPVESERGRDLARSIADTAAALGGAMSDIVWSLRPESDSLAALAAQLVARGRRIVPGPAPRLETRLPDSWPHVVLGPEVRGNVLRIGLEALHNAVRHAAARRIVLELRLEQGTWNLVVTDDGRGLGDSEPQAAHGVPGTGQHDRAMEDSTTGAPWPIGGFGLETMRRRAAAIGGKLTITSRPGEGTSVCLLFDPAAGPRRTRHPYDHPGAHRGKPV